MHKCAGLSPRVRGNPGHYPSANRSKGSIPACAGEPFGQHGLRPAGWVYPRVCGGTSLVTAAGPILSGLSPRVRGNPGHYPSANRSKGSIPACAGEPAEVRIHQRL